MDIFLIQDIITLISDINNVVNSKPKIHTGGSGSSISSLPVSLVSGSSADISGLSTSLSAIRDGLGGLISSLPTGSPSGVASAPASNIPTEIPTAVCASELIKLEVDKKDKILDNAVKNKVIL